MSSESETNPAPEAEPAVRIWNVAGMSCQHCVAAITEEVGAVAGVTSVEVDLEAGTVAVTGGAADGIESAIDEAGFDLASTGG